MPFRSMPFRSMPIYSKPFYRYAFLQWNLFSFLRLNEKGKGKFQEEEKVQHDAVPL